MQAMMEFQYLSNGATAFFSLLIHVTLLLSSFLQSTASTSLPFSGNATDQLALLALKQQIKVDPFQALSTWNESLHFCLWRGINCSRRHHQRVTTLHLTGLGLGGFISPFIGNLSFLRAIDLYDNHFTGNIPNEMGRLSRLRYVNLSQNSLGGEIPTNLSHCQRLRLIDFSSNQLVGRIPVALAALSNLVMLYLGTNSLSGGIPPSFGNLSALTHLSLEENILDGNIPEDLSRISNLSFLQISANKFSGMVPSALYNVSTIYFLSMSVNQLQGSLPPNLGLTLPNLNQFLVGGNSITGPIPASLPNASALEFLDLSANQISGSIPMNLGSLQALKYINLELNLLGTGDAHDMGIITSLTNCSLLKMLALDYNRLRGVLPNSIANLSTHLSQLWLGGNQLSGSIPKGICNLFNLIAVTMEDNSFTGTIPVEIGKLNKLQSLDLHTNRLLGQIPTSLGNMTRLSEIYLSGNRLQGSIPSTLVNCKRLSEFSLSVNNLTGSIPKHVFNITTLQILDLGSNSFDGPLPMEVGNLINLGTLDVSSNKLSNEIPKTLGNCLQLVSLNLGSNFFQGSIPSLNALKSLSFVDLSSNKLSGPIPKYLENFTSLNYLNLSFNDFEGEVPNEGIFKNASVISIIGNKKLCGSTPEFKLPKCTNQGTKKHARSFAPRGVIIVVASVLSSILLSSLFVTIYWKRKSKKHRSSTTDITEDQFLKVSYSDLVKATDGFSSDNLVGMGSYGSVYKGFFDHIETVLAVKVLNLQLRGASKSFIAECNAWRNIRHRNLVKILTACSSIDFNGNDFKALVYEYMANGNLDQWLHPNQEEQTQSRRNLNIIQRLNIAIDVASALDYLHNCCSNPVIHCDIKPSNILLDDDMNGRVADFGLSRFISQATSNCSHHHTNSVGIKGTIGYVPPEYGISGHVSTHGDVYSYGILLLEMFIGKRPTDEMFKEGLSLHQFVRMALPDQVMEIIDPRLLMLEAEGLNENQNQTSANEGIERCLVSVIRIGVCCCMTSPNERKEIRDVMMEMQVIKDLYLRDRNRIG